MVNTSSLIVEKYPVLLNFQQISEITGINVKTLRKWQNQGSLPFEAKKMGRTWKVHINQLIKFVDKFESKEPKKKRPGRPRKEEQYQAIGGK